MSARIEIVVEGTADELPDERAAWKEYALPCKPGPLERGPCQITPFHRRLDWQAWFLPFGSAEDAPWLVHWADQLLRGDPTTKKLIAVDPFPDAPPRWIRATAYRYQMVPIGGRGWWRREKVGPFLRPVRRGDPEVESLLEAHGLR